METEGNRPPRRPTGSGKALDTPAIGHKHSVGEKDRQAEANRSKPIDPDMDWPGNVTGMYSKPVKGV